MTETKNPTRTELSELGEFELIKLLTKDFGIKNKSTIKGVGDDGAIISNTEKQTVVSSDMLIEGIDFDMTYTPLRHLGYKAVAINLSDIAAMNATPKQITVNIAVSNRFSVEALNEFYAGVYLACERYDVDLVGGDTSSSPSGQNNISKWCQYPRPYMCQRRFRFCLFRITHIRKRKSYIQSQS